MIQLMSQKGARMCVAFLIFLCFIPIFVDSSSSVQGFKEMHFEGFSNHYLRGHIAQTHQVSTSLDCAFYCMTDSRCQSYNYHMEGTTNHTCDINSKNKTADPVALVNKTGFIYFQPYEPRSRRGPVQGFTANFTNLGASGRLGPSSIGDLYRGQGHDGHVTLVAGIQHWRLPCTTRYKIEAVGATGGYDSVNSGKYRGLGARIIGTFQLTTDETLKILVGQEGGINIYTSSGGGGGSFVVRSDNTPLIIAGGGGGRESPQSSRTQCHATTSTSGNQGYSSSVVWSGGSNGNGANTADNGNSGGGGGGFFTSGRSSANFGGSYGNGGEGGKGFLQGGEGGRAMSNNAHGGFGGGGGAYGNGGGAGGGGGYSGGASGDNSADSCGGGGGSYNSGDEQSNFCCFNDKGHGFVSVTWSC